MGAWVRRRLWLEAGCLDSIVEFHIGDEFWQLVVSVETAPGFLCALDKLEHHGECGLVRQAALRADRSITNGRELLSMGFVVRKFFQCSAKESLNPSNTSRSFLRAADSPVVFGFVKFEEVIEGRIGVVASLGHPNVLQRSWPSTRRSSAVC